MSWFGQVGGSLTSFTGQISNLTKDILSETINEVEDAESELIVAQRRIQELESTISLQQGELSKLKILNEELQLKAECAELQLQTLNEKYKTILADNEKSHMALLSFKDAMLRGEPEGAANDLVRSGRSHGLLNHTRQQVVYHPIDDNYNDDLDFASEALIVGKYESSSEKLQKSHNNTMQQDEIGIETHSAVNNMINEDLLHKLEEYHRDELASLQDAHDAALAEERRKGAQKVAVLKEELSLVGKEKIELQHHAQQLERLMEQQQQQQQRNSNGSDSSSSWAAAAVNQKLTSSISLETQTNTFLSNGLSNEEAVQLLASMFDISLADVDILINMLMNFRNRCSPDCWLGILADLISAETTYCSNCNASIYSGRSLPPQTTLLSRNAAATANISLDDSTSQISDLSMVSITSRALEDQVRLLQGRIAAYESVSVESSSGKSDVDAIQQELLSLCGMLKEKRKKRRGRTGRGNVAQTMSPVVLEALHSSLDEWEFDEDSRKQKEETSKYEQERGDIVSNKCQEPVEIEKWRSRAEMLEKRSQLLSKVEACLIDVGNRVGWEWEQLDVYEEEMLVEKLKHLCETTVQFKAALESAERALEVARLVLSGGELQHEQVDKFDVACNIVQLRQQLMSELTESREAVAALDEENSSLQRLLAIMKDEASFASRQREQEAQMLIANLQEQLHRLVVEKQQALDRITALESELEMIKVESEEEIQLRSDQVVELEKRIAADTTASASTSLGRIVIDAMSSSQLHTQEASVQCVSAAAAVDAALTNCTNCLNAEVETARLQLELIQLRNEIVQLEASAEKTKNLLEQQQQQQEDATLTSCARCQREMQLAQQLRFEKEQIVTVLNDKSRECSQLKSEIARLMQISVAEHAALEKLHHDNQRLKETSQLSPPKSSLAAKVASSEEEEEMTREALRHLSSLVRDKENEIEALRQRNESLLALVKVADCATTPSSDNSLNDFGWEQLLADNQALQSQLTAYQQDREQIVAALNQKHSESLTYHAELQRVIALLQKEKHLVSTLQRQLEVAARQLEERSFALTQSSEDLVRALQRCTELSCAAERGQVEFEAQLNELRKENASLSSQCQPNVQREEQLQRELERLRQHLIAVEVAYTEDALGAENREKELRNKLAAVDNNSATQAELHTKLEVVQKELAMAKSIAKQSAAEALQAGQQMLTLQTIVERLESERSKGAAQEENRATRRAQDLQSENCELKTRLLALESRIEEQSEVLSAAKRLHEQLDRKEQIVRDLRTQVASNVQEMDQLQSRIRALTSSSEAKIDKELIRNLLLGYFTAPISQRSDALRIVVSLLGFQNDDLHRLGLKAQNIVNEESRWLGWFRGGSSNSNSQQKSSEQSSLDASFTQSFVKFLERESTPTPVFKLPTPAQNSPSSVSTVKISPTSSSTSTLPVQVPLPTDVSSNVVTLASSEEKTSNNPVTQPLVIPRSFVRGGHNEPHKLISSTSGFPSNSNPLLDVLQRHY